MGMSHEELHNPLGLRHVIMDCMATDRRSTPLLCL